MTLLDMWPGVAARRPPWTCSAPLILGLAVLAGCGGGGGNEPAFTPIAGSDSAYCHTYRAWKVYELDGGEGFDQPNPAALRRFWNAYLIAEETLLQQAPPVIRDEVGVKVGHIRTVLTPLMEKYDFDLKRMRREGTAAEQAALSKRRLPRCSVPRRPSTPTRTKPAGPHPRHLPQTSSSQRSDASEPSARSLSAFNGEFDKVASSRFDPDVMRSSSPAIASPRSSTGSNGRSSRRDRR